MADQKKSPKKQIEIIDNPDLDREYTNYVSVTTALHECNVTFCKIDPLKIKENKTSADVVAKISIPNSMVQEVLDVIHNNFNKNIEKFEKKLKEKTKKKK